MKATAAVILLLASALAAPAAAQTAAEPMLKTKWSLDQPRKKAPAKQPMAAPGQARQQQAKAQGPAVPAPQRVKVPKTRTAARAAQAARNNRVNATPLAAAVLRKQNKQ